MSQQKITDAGVAGLPVHEGRAELLEEIMATTPLETTDTGGPRPARHPDGLPPHRRWLPALGAAAAVLALAAGAVWVDHVQDDRPAGERRDADVAGAPAPGSGQIAVLPVDGWELQYASIDPRHGGELSYEATDQGVDATPDDDWGVTLDIHWRPADSYDEYVEDREQITRRPSPGEPVEVLGRPGLLWAYSADDHTVIREVVGDFFLEIRGSGMDRADYLALLGQLEGIAPRELDAHLPDDFVTDAERAEVIAEMLAPIPVPPSLDADDIRSSEADRYQLGADVTRAVTCAWIGRFEQAQQRGDRAAMDEAAEAMATSRDWPILVEMAQGGGWSDVIWEYADELAAGRVPEGYRGGLGCG